MKKTALIFLFLFVLFLGSAYGLSIGVSPEEITFDKSNVERQVILFNPNEVNVSFNISIEYQDDKFIIQRKGEINANDLLKLRIRYNSTYFNDLETKMDIKYSVNDSSAIGIMPAASVNIIVYGEEGVLTMKDKTQEKPSVSASKDNIKNISTIIAIIIVIAIFIYLMLR